MNAITKHETHDQVSEPRQQAEGLLGVIQRVATDDKFDVEKMKALLEMRASEEDRVRRIEREDRDEEAKREWLRGFSKVQSEVGPIVRGRSNDHTRSKYADLADIERIVTPILTSHGFSTTCVPIPCEMAGHIRMRLTIGHSEGHEKVYEDDFPLDGAGSGGKVNKTPIQAKGSTQTYARRYLKASALDLAFMDDNDGNAPSRAPDTVSAEQYVALRDRAEEAGVAEEKICLAAGVSDLHQFPAKDFDAAMNRLAKNIAAKQETANA